MTTHCPPLAGKLFAKKAYTSGGGLSEPNFVHPLSIFVYDRTSAPPAGINTVLLIVILYLFQSSLL